MLPKASRLNLKEVEHFKVVNRVRGQLFNLEVRSLATSGSSRFAIVVSKKVSKKAVDRNRLRRQISSLISLILSTATTGLGVIVYAKPPAASATFGQIKQELSELLKRSNVI